MDVRSDWFTTARLSRAATALTILSKDLRRWPWKEASRTIFRGAGGTIAEVDDVLGQLVAIRLVEVKGETIRVTTSGQRVAAGCVDGDLRAIGLTLIRAGCFRDQARSLIEAGSVQDDGSLECPTAFARNVASQLIGLLEWWDGVELLPVLRIPGHLVQELGSIVALLPTDTSAPKWLDDQKTVGNRAEAYTVKWERTRASDPGLIAHVALDSDRFGWDVEDRSGSELRRIEVKGHRSPEIVFNISANEWAKARKYGQLYELQFWGEINLRVDPEVEYATLTAAGYPTCIKDLASELDSGRWVVLPTSWRVSQPT